MGILVSLMWVTDLGFLLGFPQASSLLSLPLPSWREEPQNPNVGLLGCSRGRQGPEQEGATRLKRTPWGMVDPVGWFRFPHLGLASQSSKG